MYSGKHTIEKYLYEWLLENDTLTVPNLGQFDAVYKSASLQITINQFSPPTKNLIFNPTVKENDGSFENYLASKEQLILLDAQSKIQQYVTAVKIEVGIQRKYYIEPLGTLRLNPLGVLEFVQEENTSFLGSSYGLPTLHYKPIERTAVVVDDKEEDLIFDLNEEDKKGYNFPILRIVSYAAIVGGLATGIWYFTATDQGNKLIKSLGNSLSSTSSKAQEDPNKIIDIEENKKENEPEKDKVETIDNKKTEATKKAEENKKTTTEPKKEPLIKKEIPKENPQSNNPNQVKVTKALNRAYVVSGSFGTEDLANTFYKNLVSRGANQAKIIYPNAKSSNYRVSLNDFSTKKQADESIAQLKQQYNVKDLWILEY
jgi:CCDC81-like prokaryotic HU domain 1/SPOR domain